MKNSYTKKKPASSARLKQEFSGRVETLVVVNPDKHVFEVLRRSQLIKVKGQHGGDESNAR